MEIKHLTAQLKDIKSGDVRDDAQYIQMFFDNSSRQVKEIFTCKLNDGTEYTGRLFGRSEVIDADGNQLNDCKIYLDYITKGKKNLLHNTRNAGIEIVERSGKVVNVFTTMHDCFDYLEKKELKN